MFNENEYKPFAYIDKTYLETYGLVIDETDDNFKNIQLYINFACERINTISGNEIEKVKFENLNSVQQIYVRKATSYYCVWLFKNGTQFFRGGMSISSQGISISQNGPDDPDYVLKNIYYLLQQAQLYFPRAYFNDFSDNCKESNIINPTQEQDYNTGPFSGCDYPISYRAMIATIPKGDNIHWLSSDGSVSIEFGRVNGEIEKTVDIKAKGGSGNFDKAKLIELINTDADVRLALKNFIKEVLFSVDDPLTLNNK